MKNHIKITKTQRRMKHFQISLSPSFSTTQAFSKSQQRREDLHNSIEVTPGVGLIPQATLAPLPVLRLPMDGKARAQKIDDWSRLVFPLTFVLFNVVYWIGYIHVVSH